MQLDKKSSSHLRHRKHPNTPFGHKDGVRFGDNDNLAALTAVQLEAGGVFLFTDVDYLYTANPNVDPAAEPMKVLGLPPGQRKKTPKTPR